jgi:hypothetical protein
VQREHCAPRRRCRKGRERDEKKWKKIRFEWAKDRIGNSE